MKVTLNTDQLKEMSVADKHEHVMQLLEYFRKENGYIMFYDADEPDEKSEYVSITHAFGGDLALLINRYEFEHGIYRFYKHDTGKSKTAVYLIGEFNVNVAIEKNV